MLTARKAIDALRREQARPPLPQQPDDSAGIDQIVGAEPTPSFAAEVAEECRCLLDQLNDDTLPKVAVLKLEGCTNVEIAGRLSISRASVERKLKLIRKKWEKKGARRG